MAKGSWGFINKKVICSDGYWILVMMNFNWTLRWSKALFANTNELCWPVCRDLERFLQSICSGWDLQNQSVTWNKMWLVPKSCWTFLLNLDAFLAFSWIRKITENGLATKDGAFSSFRPLGRSAVRMFSFSLRQGIRNYGVYFTWQVLWSSFLCLYVLCSENFATIFHVFEEGKGRPKREEGLKRKGRLPVSTCYTFAIFYIFLFWSLLSVFSPPFLHTKSLSRMLLRHSRWFPARLWSLQAP